MLVRGPVRSFLELLCGPFSSQVDKIFKNVLLTEVRRALRGLAALQVLAYHSVRAHRSDAPGRFGAEKLTDFYLEPRVWT